MARTFGKNLWCDHESRAYSEQCSRNNGTRRQRASSVNLRLFAVMCVSLRFGKNTWQEHLARTQKSRAHSEQCSRNNGTRSQWASVNLRLFAVMCVFLGAKANDARSMNFLTYCLLARVDHELTVTHKMIDQLMCQMDIDAPASTTRRRDSRQRLY